MSSENNTWSAQLAGVPLPEKLEYQRAVWGKAHGARSDFRWLACSAGFVKDDELERKKLMLGSQDAPSELYFWRYLPETSRYYAGKAYPSRATDASGRTGFLEKQLLEWSKTSAIPAALAAILLFALVKKWGDEIWWQRRDEIDWSNDGSVLVIDVQPLELPEQRNPGKILDSFISIGLEELNELQTELTRCYARLLAHEKPAVLYASKPLKPESLATLMLPLEAALANNLSIAGWIPSAYPELNKLGENWDIVVLPEASTSTLSEQAQQLLPRARLMVEALLQNRSDLLKPKPERAQEGSQAVPSGQPGNVTSIEETLSYEQVIPTGIKSMQGSEPKPIYQKLHEAYPNAVYDLPKTAKNFPGKFNDFINLIYDFANKVKCRNLDPKVLKQYFPDGLEHYRKTNSDSAKLFVKQLDEWINFIKVPPENVDAMQWQVKIEQLHALAFALVPSEERKQQFVIENKKIPLSYYSGSLI